MGDQGVVQGRGFESGIREAKVPGIEIRNTHGDIWSRVMHAAIGAQNGRLLF